MRTGPSSARRPTADVLRAGTVVSSKTLRPRLFELVSELACSRCTLTEWLGAPIPLEVDHMNGDWPDNRVENLRLLRPNCHARTETYRGRNKPGRRRARTAGALS